MGKHKETKTYYERAMKIRKATLGEEHFGAAMTCNDLGNVCSDMGNYKEAEGEFYERAMKIRKATLSVNHTSIAESKISPAVSSQGMWEKGGRKNGRRRVQRVAIFKVVVVRLQTIGGWRRCGPFSGLCWIGRWIPGGLNRCSRYRTRARRCPWPRKTTASSPRLLSVFSLQ